MAIPVNELQDLRDAAIRNKSAGIVNVRFSDGRSVQYVSTPDQWQKIITDLDAAITQANTGAPEVRFTLPHFSRD